MRAFSILFVPSIPACFLVIVIVFDVTGNAHSGIDDVEYEMVLVVVEKNVDMVVDNVVDIEVGGASR